MPRATITLAASLLLALVGSACEKDDLGEKCGTDALPVVDPVGGEVPVTEIVRMERDGECESFQCLTHRGLPPYCTRECELLPSEHSGKSCSTDTDCTGGMFRDGAQGVCVEGTCACDEDSQCASKEHCADGVCRDDDCPSGFWCKSVQEVGAISEKQYCVFKDGCQDDFDCESIGKIECSERLCFDVCMREYWVCEESDNLECEELGCYDNCIWQGGDTYLCTDEVLEGIPNDEEDRVRLADCNDAQCYAAELCSKQLEDQCDFNRLVCEPRTNLNCCCSDGGNCDDEALNSCADEFITCQPDSSRPAWDEGTVTKAGFCLPKDF